MSAGDWKDFYKAIDSGDFELVRFHVKSGIDLNYQHPEILMSPLVTAIEKGHTDIAAYLIENGADVNLESHYHQQTPWTAAIASNNLEIIKLLTNQGARPNLFFKLDSRKIFLVDGVGAILSFISTGFILPVFAVHLGISISILNILALFPLVLMFYSLYCYKFVKDINSWMLKLLITLNATYILISFGLIFFYKPIEALGVMLLVSEIIILTFLLRLELKILKTFFPVKKI